MSIVQPSLGRPWTRLKNGRSPVYFEGCNNSGRRSPRSRTWNRHNLCLQSCYVSNHGGRQLDHGRATIDVLPEIVESVNGEAKIVLDGGIVRGSDVLKAIALGATAVTIGKLQGWGLAAAGQAGLVRVLELLEREIITTMGLLGVTRLDQLRPAHLCKVQPLGPTHEMSAFLHIPGGQLL